MSRAQIRKRPGWIESEEKRMKKLDEKLGAASSGVNDKSKIGDQTVSVIKDVSGSGLASAPKETPSMSTTTTNKVASSNARSIEQQPHASEGHMIEVTLNDRLGKKIKVKCNSDDTVGDLKKLTAAQIGSRPEKLRIQKWYTVFKDHIALQDYEVIDGMSLELYYN